MNMEEMIATAPISTQLSTRPDQIRAITSCQPGVVVPLHFIPMLREDRVARAEIRVSFDMSESLYPLLNAVNVCVYAHFVSYLAFDRFDGFDSFNRSYQGVVEPSTGTAIPFFPTIPFAKAAPVWKSLGVQWPEGTSINQAPVEAYNTLVNYRRKSRTDKLSVRTATDTTLARGFWKNTVANSVVPDWDQSAMEGEVALSFAPGARAWIQGIGGFSASGQPVITPNVNVIEKDPLGVNRIRMYPYSAMANDPDFRFEVGSTGVPAIFSELAGAGVTVSLANLELAKQTQAFAKLRERYDGIDDEHIIDLLMEGIRVPDEAMKQPILLDMQRTVFGMEERHAMDGENLDLSRTTGQTSVMMRFRTPPMNTGGIILITCEIVPEQLHERLGDQFLGTTTGAQLPNFTRDFLDPEKVEVVQNKRIDVHHGTPTGTFGYAPLNDWWKRNYTRAGGKFYRPNPDVFVEDRMRFWSADQINPTLAEDFYLVRNLPNTVFADTLSDPFEVVTIGQCGIIGNTVFGEALVEDAGAYDEIMAEVDKTRIIQAGTLDVPQAKPKEGQTDA